MAAATAIAAARYRESEAKLRESKARYREARTQREYMYVRASFQGIIISKEAEVGESIMPGGMERRRAAAPS